MSERARWAKEQRRRCRERIRRDHSGEAVGGGRSTEGLNTQTSSAEVTARICLPFWGYGKFQGNDARIAVSAVPILQSVSQSYTPPSMEDGPTRTHTLHTLYNKLYNKIALYIALQRRRLVTRRM